MHYDDSPGSSGSFMFASSLGNVMHEAGIGAEQNF